MNDPVKHPAHYNLSKAKCAGCGRRIECIDINKHWNYPLGNALKYMWRADLKGSAIEDLEKAANYLQYELNRRRAEASAVRRPKRGRLRGLRFRRQRRRL